MASGALGQAVAGPLKRGVGILIVSPPGLAARMPDDPEERDVR